MQKTEKTEKKERRLGLRVDTEVFYRLEEAMPRLKRDARSRGEKTTQQAVVEGAITHYLNFLEGKGDEMALAVQEIWTIGSEKTRRMLKAAIGTALEEARATEERRTKQGG